MALEQDHSQFKQGYIYVLRLLSISNRSSRELEKRLHEKGYPDEVADAIIERLKETGALNEKKNIHEIIQWAINGKHLGRKRIKIELKQKGFQESAIDEELEAYSKDEENNQAWQLAENKIESLKKTEPQKRKKHVYDFLVRRGFDFEIARETAMKINEEVEKQLHENV